MLNYFKANYHQMIKFILIGITTFCINFLSFHFFYSACTLNYKIATSLAYTITVISHFTLNRIFTFEIKGNEHQLSHIRKYFLMLIFNYITTITVMWLTVEVIHASPYLGLVASTAATASTSYFVMKYFVFSNRAALQE